MEICLQTHLFIFICISGWILSPIILILSIWNNKLFIFYCLCTIFSNFLITSNIYEKYLKPKIRYNKVFKNYKYYYEDSIDFESSKNMFCFHPHGIFCFCFSSQSISVDSFLNNFKRKTNYLVTGILLKLQPIFLLLKLVLGSYINSVEKKTMMKIMSNNENIALLPGGFFEASLSQVGKNKIYIKNKYGFIKLALNYGYTVYPIYCFGENDLYYNLFEWIFPDKIKFFLNKYKIPCVLPFGNFYLPRYKVNLITVIGKGIKCPKTTKDNLTIDIIREYQNKYIDEIIRIFDKYKNLSDNPDDKLIIY